MKLKHYIKLAQAIKESSSYAVTYMNTRQFVDALCDILAEENPKFDRQKFMEMCK